MSEAFTEQEYQKLFDDLNDRIAQDPELRGNTFAINPDSISSAADLNKVTNDLIAARGGVGEDGVSENAESLLEFGAYAYVYRRGEIAIGRKIQSEKLDLEGDEEIGIAIGVPRAETVEENFAMLAADKDADVDFSSRVNPEYSVKSVLYHELGHTVMMDRHHKADAREEIESMFNEHSHAKYADNTMASYDVTVEELRADAFSSLMWIQEGGDVNDIKTMISARNHALGFRPDGTSISKDLTHDSAGAMQLIVDDIDEIQSSEEFKDMSISELAEMADSYAQKAAPSYESYVEMSAEQDVIRSILQKSYTMDENSQAIAESQRLQPLTEDGAQLAIRFNEAYEDLHGKPSPLVNDERYKDVLEDDMVAKKIESAMDAINSGSLAPDADGTTYSGHIEQKPAIVTFNEQSSCIESITLENSDASHSKLEFSENGACDVTTYDPQALEAQNDEIFDRDADLDSQKATVTPQNLAM